jgi:hypothetical protein
LSIGSPAIGPFAGPFSRYFMSQICCEIEATTAISALSLIQSGDVSVYHSSGARLHLQAFCRRAGDPYWEMLTQSSYFVPYTQAVKTGGAKISPDYGFGCFDPARRTHISEPRFMVEFRHG